MTFALAALWLVGGASAQSIVNGGFELPGLPFNTPMLHLTNGSTFLPGWTVIDDGIGEQPFYAQLPNAEAVVAGGYGLILNAGSGVKTTFRATPSFYELALWLRPSDCKECVSPAPLQVTINDNVYSVPLLSGWTRQTIQFFTTNSVNTLELLNPSSSGDYKQFGLDEVSIAHVKGAVLGVRFYPGVIIDGATNQHYDIQAAPDLNAPNWVTITNIFLTNSPYIFIDMDTKRPLDYPPDRRIYRAVEVP